jgi:hypothetical protein
VQGRGRVYTGFWWGNLREIGHLEEPGRDGKTILSWIFRKWDAGRGPVCLAQYRDRWQAVVNAVMNLRIS